MTDQTPWLDMSVYAVSNDELALSAHELEWLQRELQPVDVSPSEDEWQEMLDVAVGEEDWQESALVSSDDDTIDELDDGVCEPDPAEDDDLFDHADENDACDEPDPEWFDDADLDHGGDES